jgi:hypothetical protein
MFFPEGFAAPPLVDFVATSPYIKAKAQFANHNSNLQRVS